MGLEGDIRKLIEQEQALRKTAYNLSVCDVDCLIKKKITAEDEIDVVIDHILDFITDEKFSVLYDKLVAYVSTFDKELSEIYCRLKKIFLEYYYDMDGAKFIKGDIFAPNKTGHECFVCHLMSINGMLCSDIDERIKSIEPTFYEQCNRYLMSKKDRTALLGSTTFQAIEHKGYSYTIVSMFIRDNGEDKFFDHKALREAIKSIGFSSKPLPARTLTTVRIPYKMGCDISVKEWEEVYQIIQEELVEEGIPVEIWQ